MVSATKHLSVDERIEGELTVNKTIQTKNDPRKMRDVCRCPCPGFTVKTSSSCEMSRLEIDWLVGSNRNRRLNDYNHTEYNSSYQIVFGII